MDLKIKPYHKNIYPLSALIINGSSVYSWLTEIEYMGLTSNDCTVYPLPSETANSVGGCFIIVHKPIKGIAIGKNERCQKVTENLYISENSILSPCLGESEFDELFKEKHLFHPHYGLVELESPIDFGTIFSIPDTLKKKVTKPSKPAFVPKSIHRFQIQPIPPEEVMKTLEESAFPKQEQLEDKPLSVAEKAQYATLKKLFKKKEEIGGKVIEKTSLLSNIEKLFRPLTKNVDSWTDNLKKNFEDLDRRNQKELDKLLDMLKDNPDEALKYALPLDGEGTGRGEEVGEFRLSRIWNSFSLNQSYGSGRASGGYINLNKGYDRLREQYQQTAQALISEGKYEKAAFVYMKLLKDFYAAADALEKGKMYVEAATVYLEKTANKEAAAKCFVKANMIEKAIELYVSMKEYETVGDLYMQINKEAQAFNFYTKLASEYLNAQKHIKAAEVFKQKMDNTKAAQRILFDGWTEDKNALNCLHVYFQNIENEEELMSEIKAIYDNGLKKNKKDIFIKALKGEYKRREDLRPELKEIAYEIVSDLVAENPYKLSYLEYFNNEDRHLKKDIMRYQMVAMKKK